MERSLAQDLARFLRACADAVELGDLDATDVRQALFDADGYRIGHPISETAGTGAPGDPARALAIDELDKLATRIVTEWRRPNGMAD